MRTMNMIDANGDLNQLKPQNYHNETYSEIIQLRGDRGLHYRKFEPT